MTPISVPAQYSSDITAGAINDFGQIVGVYGTIGQTPSLQGFFDNRGTFTSINAPGDAYTVVNGINDFGETVGYGATSLGAPNQAFVNNRGTFTLINVPGASELTDATSINNFGEVAGFYRNGSETISGFLDNNGSFTTIDVPGATNTEIFGVNDFGQVVGTAWGLPGEANGQTEAFVESGGVFTLLNGVGSNDATIAFGINDAGQIVGLNNSGASAFIATVTRAPEIDSASAASGATFLLGCILVLRGRRRHIP